MHTIYNLLVTKHRLQLRKQVSNCESFSLYAADESLCGRNILQSVVNWYTYCYLIVHDQFAYIKANLQNILLDNVCVIYFRRFDPIWVLISEKDNVTETHRCPYIMYTWMAGISDWRWSLKLKIEYLIIIYTVQVAKQVLICMYAH